MTDMPSFTVEKKIIKFQYLSSVEMTESNVMNEEQEMTEYELKLKRLEEIFMRNIE
jgi:hypothetical protein